MPVSTMIGRMTTVVDAFDTPNAVLSLDQVSRRTGLPRSSAHRIILEMIEWDWLVRWEQSYMLGPRAVGVIGPVATGARIRIAAADILQDLYLRTGLVVHLGILVGAQDHFLDKIGGPFARQVPTKVGSRIPAYLSVGGRAMLAALPPEAVDQLVAPRLRPSDGWSMQSLHTELSRIRAARGISYEPTERSSGIPNGGIGSVGCAVRRRDGTIVSLCAAGPSKTVDLALVAPAVRNAARLLDASF